MSPHSRQEYAVTSTNPTYSSVADVPPLKNWIGVGETMEILDVVRQTVWKMAFKTGALQQVRRIGNSEHPILLLNEKEVRALAVRRAADQAKAYADPSFKIPRGENTPLYERVEDAPELPDWITTLQAAPLLGMASQPGVYKLVFNSRRLQHVRRVGGQGAPTVLLYLPEVTALAKQRAEEAKGHAVVHQRETERKAAKAYRMQVREWLRDQGVIISNFTSPTPEQFQMFEAAHARQAAKNTDE